MKSNRRSRRVKVSADGTGLVSRAGTLLLRELTVYTGLAAGWTEVLLDTYRAFPTRHAPGRVLADLAVTIADGGDALTHLAGLRDQGKLFGPVASEPTAWRAVARVDEAHLVRLRAVRAAARDRAWAAGAGPDIAAGLTIDLDATITVAHSEKDNAAKTWKKTFGFHPLLAYLDRPDVAGGEALAVLLRPGNAGSNTAADHVTVLDMALAALPAAARPTPAAGAGPVVLVRTDAAGATHVFAAALRERGCVFSLGFAIDETVQAAVLAVPETEWTPARNIDGEPRGAGGRLIQQPPQRPLPEWHVAAGEQPLQFRGRQGSGMIGGYATPLQRHREVGVDPALPTAERGEGPYGRNHPVPGGRRDSRIRIAHRPGQPIRCDRGQPVVAVELALHPVEGEFVDPPAARRQVTAQEQLHRVRPTNISTGTRSVLRRS